MLMMNRAPTVMQKLLEPAAATSARIAHVACCGLKACISNLCRQPTALA
jgi:hypothetical protein